MVKPLSEILRTNREEFEKEFVEYSSEGRKQIRRIKPWFNNHTESYEEPNEADEVIEFLSTASSRIIEGVKEFVESKRLKRDTEYVDVRETQTIYNAALDDIESYLKE